MDDEKYTRMEGLAKEFESGIGKKLQRYLFLKVGALYCFLLLTFRDRKIYMYLKQVYTSTYCIP